ncbi:MAG: DUF2024 family protein [Calditrichia bacterium]
MKASVFDTYVPRKEGGVMHFDIVVPVNTTFEDVQKFGLLYLTEKKQGSQPLTTKECRFCHIGTATDAMKQDIVQKGYHIIEIDGC